MRFVSALVEVGVGTAVHYPTPVHLQPAYVDLARVERSLETAERLASEIVSLPIYPELLDDEVDHRRASCQRYGRAVNH